MAYLNKIGGGTVDNNVQRILVRMFTNEAAQYFSWEGKSGKKRLDQLIIVKIISSTSFLILLKSIQLFANPFSAGWTIPYRKT